VAFLSRARAFFAAHGIHWVVHVVTDNGANYRVAAFELSLISWASRHQQTMPYTPRHNGKVERYQRILAEELLYARQWPSEAERARRSRSGTSTTTTTDLTTAVGNRPPASRLYASVTDVMSSNTQSVCLLRP
jgi:hypothetical protein